MQCMPVLNHLPGQTIESRGHRPPAPLCMQLTNSQYKTLLISVKIKGRLRLSELRIEKNFAR